MTQDALNVVTPVGRFVWGSYPERETQDYNGNPYEAGKGPITMGLAIRKDDPNVGALLGSIYQQAAGGYPNNANIQSRIQNEWQSGFSGGLFKFKVRDGDKPNDKGQMNENTKGCWVFSLSTHFADLRACDSKNAQIDPKTVLRGYYVDVNLGIKVNGLTDGNAGVFLNPNVVRLVAYGDKITGGMSIEDAFASAPAPTNLPPGASLTPLAPAGAPPVPPQQQTLPPAQGGMPGLPPATAPAAAPAPAPAMGGVPGMPGMTAAPTDAPAAQPYPGFTQVPGMPGQ